MGNLLSPAANLFFLYGTASYLASLGQPAPWHFGSLLPTWILGPLPPHLRHCAAADRRARPSCGARIYGWRFAAAVPIRMFWGNLVNFAATATALWEFWNAQPGAGDWPGARRTMSTRWRSPRWRLALIRFHPLADASANAVAGESY